MIFFTRDLYEGIQPQSGWERRALREWKRRSRLYSRYVPVIVPLLPRAVARLCRIGLHDALVHAAKSTSDSFNVTLDARDALSEFRGDMVTLAFTGVRGRVPTRRLLGDTWLYEEAHLAAGGFTLHVLFEHTDLEVRATGLSILRERSNR